MTRLANTTLKGMNYNEVKELLKKERKISKRDWFKAEPNVYGVEYEFDKYLFLTLDENKIVTKIDKLIIP